ncbi:MAG: hypothetical protein KGZ39_01700 [Simkania sp.]|nr:hypothetical protein [Simkania sp.]
MSNIGATLSFNTLIGQYIKLQSKVVSMVRYLSSSLSQATPGRFLLLQFAMSQVAQIGESISNLISQVQSLINLTVRNQKGG